MRPWAISLNTARRRGPMDNSWTLVTMLMVLIGLAVVGVAVMAL